jgi:hypothetical protein
MSESSRVRRELFEKMHAQLAALPMARKRDTRESTRLIASVRSQRATTRERGAQRSLRSWRGRAAGGRLRLSLHRAPVRTADWLFIGVDAAALSVFQEIVSRLTAVLFVSFAATRGLSLTAFKRSLRVVTGLLLVLAHKVLRRTKTASIDPASAAPGSNGFDRSRRMRSVRNGRSSRRVRVSPRS